MHVTRYIDKNILRKGEYMPSLDGWRAIAILLVIIGHSMDDIALLLPAMGAAVDLGGLKFIGMHGVQVFFGLSGFLITSKLLSDEQKHGRIALWAFYMRRSFRILPATLFFLIAVGSLSLTGVLDVSLGRWLSSLLFSANYSTAEYSWYLGHFWSLAVEEHFYLVWPALFLLLGAVRKRLVWAFALTCAVAVWRAIDFKFQVTGTTSAIFMGRTDIQVDHILWGVVIALANADPYWRPRLNALLADGRMTAMLLLVLAGLLFVYDVGWKLKFALLSIHGLVVPLAIMSTYQNSQCSITRFLEMPVMRLIGRLSFSIYLWQQLFFVWPDARVPGLAAIQVFPANIAAITACAMISFWLIEEPCIALGRTVLRRWPAFDRQASRQSVIMQSMSKL